MVPSVKTGARLLDGPIWVLAAQTDLCVQSAFNHCSSLEAADWPHVWARGGLVDVRGHARESINCYRDTGSWAVGSLI